MRSIGKLVILRIRNELRFLGTNQHLNAAWNMRCTVLFVIVFAYFFISAVAKAESVGEFLSENGAPDLAKVKNIVLMAEADWQKKDFIAYFEKMGNLCQKLVNREEVSSADYMLFLENASQVLLKPDKVVQPHDIAITHYERVANMLVPETLFSIETTPEIFLALRSRNTRLLMIVLSKARAARIPNFKHGTLFADVDPPINPGKELLITGMDPADIKNPAARAAYEKAITDNTKAVEEYKEQLYIERLLEHTVPKVEQYLVKAYSIKPFNDAELGEYMAL